MRVRVPIVADHCARIRSQPEDDGGNVAAAAMACGLADMPKGTKALWGRSAAEAWATFRRWQKQRQRA